jgi:hypothetical protein
MRMYCTPVSLVLMAFFSGLGLLGQVPVQFNTQPTRVVGHAKLQLVSTAPNLVEGRELNRPKRHRGGCGKLPADSVRGRYNQ